VRKQRVVLEHHANAALVRRHVVDRIAVEINLAVGGRLKTGQHHQGCCLARAGWAEHGHKLALGDIEVQILYNQRFAVIALLNVFKANHWFASTSIFRHLIP
jgi:hypothetical protein